MRTHAKAPTARPTPRASISPRRNGIAAVLVLSLMAFCGISASAAMAAAPAVTIEPAFNVSFNTAQAKGTVNPEGKYTSYHFEFVTQEQFESNGFAEPTWAGYGELGEEAGLTEVTATLEGLKPGTTYHLRLVASNEEGESEAVAPTFETEAVEPPVVENLAVTSVTSSSAHLSGIVRSGGTGAGEATEYRFECPGCPGFQPITSDGTNQTVEADAEELLPNQPYTFKLIARDAAGQEVSEEKEVKTEAIPPQVETLPADEISPHHASLQGNITIENSPTTYYYEYGTSTSYGTKIPPTPAPASQYLPKLQYPQELYGLEPGTEYHFRLVAENEAGKTVGSDQAFTTTTPPVYGSCANESFRSEQHATQLPDCRAYEMVSTPDKAGADIISDSGRARAATDGSAFEYDSLGGFAGIEGSSIANEYMAERTGQTATNGWITHPITPPLEPMSFDAIAAGYESLYEYMSPDLHSGVYRAYSPLTEDSEVAGTENLYLRNDLLSPGFGSYQLISACPVCNGTPIKSAYKTSQIPRFDAMSADHHHVLFESPFSLSPDAPTPEPFTHFCSTYGVACIPKLYEWEDGTVRYAGMLPSGEPAISSTAGGTEFKYTTRRMSEDGSRVLFEVPTGEGRGNLYMRINHTTTVKINQSEREEPGEPQEATFSWASPDLRYVFFMTSEQLTENDHNGTADIYRYDAEAPTGHHLTLISIGKPGERMGLLGASDDGHYAYFMASQQLISGGPAIGRYALYLWHDGTLSLIGAMGDNETNETLFNLPLQKQFADEARVTPSGRYLLFMSESGSSFGDSGGAGGRLTGYSHVLKKEMYLYDAAMNRLSCVSCPEDGTPVEEEGHEYGRMGVSASDMTLENIGGSQSTQYLSHALVDNGRYVFFNSFQALVPEDTNGRWDVYEYDTKTGTQHLISSGDSPYDSFFIDATQDGKNVFFTTRQQLVGWDTDGAYDVYDARVEGGFPEPTPQPAECSGERCRPAAGEPPQGSSPGSAQVQGKGNVPPRCRHGFVRRTAKVHGKKVRRCVKRHRHHHASRHHHKAKGRTR